jgi:murein DD-endopeptidase MepM/ murein hydrolase activator NlpD
VPFGFRHSVAQARASAESVVVSVKSSIDDAALRGALTPAQAQLLPLPVRNRMDPGDSLDAAAVGLYGSSEAGANHEHLIRFAWPTHGTLTQTFSDWHPGIDIANQVGTPENAADGGRVVFAGWGGYGIYVEIDHGNGFHTLYGHMSAVMVTPGEVVVRGQLIGLMGATGRASGSHLHFEILYQGVPQNPIDLLS